MLPTFCVTVSPNLSQIDISVIEINSVLGIGVSLLYMGIYTYIWAHAYAKDTVNFNYAKVYLAKIWRRCLTKIG